ncbi:hypothetical protein BASA81_005819 [Batrachochytrium salamandrivorans]|nr:hypothetical protein BASA81_005819 [Batrachochytrium salamandrivorans]
MSERRLSLPRVITGALSPVSRSPSPSPSALTAAAYYSSQKSLDSIISAASLQSAEEEATAVRPPPPPPKRKSLFRRSLILLGADSSPPPPPPARPAGPITFTTNMIRLSIVITTRKNSLIKSLVQYPGDFVVRIRFVDTVEQFLSEPDPCKQRAKADKIVEIFFPPTDSGSMFGLRTSMTEYTVRKLLGAHYHPHMIDARNQVLEGLSNSPLVLESVDKMLQNTPSAIDT